MVGVADADSLLPPAPPTGRPAGGAGPDGAARAAVAAVAAAAIAVTAAAAAMGAVRGAQREGRSAAAVAFEDSNGLRTRSHAAAAAPSATRGRRACGGRMAGPGAWGPDPNNRRWADDTGRLGYRLLQRMGWRAGGGLGAREQGLTAPIVPAAERLGRGLGARAAARAGPSGIQHAFDGVLKGLRPIGAAAPAARAAGSKRRRMLDQAAASRRLFYGRTLRAKDAAAYPATARAGIFGLADANADADAGATSEPAANREPTPAAVTPSDDASAAPVRAGDRRKRTRSRRRADRAPSARRPQ